MDTMIEMIYIDNNWNVKDSQIKLYKNCSKIKKKLTMSWIQEAKKKGIKY